MPLTLHEGSTVSTVMTRALSSPLRCSRLAHSSALPPLAVPAHRHRTRTQLQGTAKGMGAVTAAFLPLPPPPRMLSGHNAPVSMIRSGLTVQMMSAMLSRSYLMSGGSGGNTPCRTHFACQRWLRQM